MPKVERVYLRRRFPQIANVDNTKYVPPAKCKRCGEKWDSGHKFVKRKRYQDLCEATNDSYSEESDIEEVEDSPQFSSKLDRENIPQVSLSAMTDISKPQTL